MLVWIHGGGYAIGGAELYGYKTIVEQFVSKGLVVVSIQYRLGPLGQSLLRQNHIGSGFLSTGDQVVSGNLGYWDQTAALAFIQANIAPFGGDPSRVTVFGLSAGGASVAALTLSPHSRGENR